MILLGIVVLVLGIIISGYIKTEVTATLYKVFVYKYDSNFDDPNYEKCTVSTEIYYLNNLTNVVEFIEGSAKPNFKELGPYTYNITTCIWGVKLEGDIEYYYQYRDEPVLISSGVTDHDVIFNYNPAWAAITKPFETLPSPEYAMMFAFFAEFLQSIIEGMQTTTFIEDVTAAALPYLNRHTHTTYSASYVLQSTQEELILLEFGTPDNFYTAWLTGYGTWYLAPTNTTPSSDITVSASAQLWNSSNPYSFTNPNGNLYWLAAGNNATILSELATVFDLSALQVGTVITWLFRYLQTEVPNALLVEFGIDNLSQLAYVQWGQGTVLGGYSIQHYLPPGELSVAPEFSFFAAGASSPIRFNGTFANNLLNDSVNGLFNPVNLLTFLSVYEDASLLSAFWGLSVDESAILAAYFIELGVGEIIEPLLLFSFTLGSGPIVGRIPKEWIWNGTDPLLDLLQAPDDHIGLLLEYRWMTKEEASSTLWNKTVYLGGSSDDLDYWLHAHDWYGDEYIPLWRSPQLVDGYKGEGVLPGQSDSLDSIPLWILEIGRSAPLNKVGTIEVYGITLNKYQCDKSFWEVNDFYYQPYNGFINRTGMDPVNLWFSLPNWALADDTITNNITGLTPSDSDTDFYIAIEPQSGIAMKVHLGLGINLNYINNNYFYPGMSGWTMMPIGWSDSDVEIDEADATAFKNSLASAKALEVALLAVGIGVGILLIAGGVLMIAMAWRRTKTTWVKPVEEHM